MHLGGEEGGKGNSFCDILLSYESSDWNSAVALVVSLPYTVEFLTATVAPSRWRYRVLVDRQ
jgi:hypothetical protein